MWALTALVHVYDFLSGMADAFGRRERGGGACGCRGARLPVRSMVSWPVASGIMSKVGRAGFRG
jgi:hypothetical protein